MNRIDIADYGKTDIYNTHLCSECDASGRTQQVKSLLNFISTVEKSIPGKNPVILGGDFNINLFNSTERPGYKLILKSGFIDTYDAINHVGFTCCTPTSGGSCCTFGVPGNPYAIDFLTHLPEFPQRLDYIFTKGISATNIINSTVVFNTDSFVSDHSGVLTKVLLP